MEIGGDHWTPPQLWLQVCDFGVCNGILRMLRMKYKTFNTSAIKAFYLFVTLVITGSPETAPARHTEALKTATMASLMSNMQIQVIDPVSRKVSTIYNRDN